MIPETSRSVGEQVPEMGPSKVTGSGGDGQSRLSQTTWVSANESRSATEARGEAAPKVKRAAGEACHELVVTATESLGDAPGTPRCLLSPTAGSARNLLKGKRCMKTETLRCQERQPHGLQRPVSQGKLGRKSKRRERGSFLRRPGRGQRYLCPGRPSNGQGYVPT